jgi:hypothetical protein
MTHESNIKRAARELNVALIKLGDSHLRIIAAT